MVSDRYLTLNELADRLSVSPRVIYGLRYRGDGPPGVRVGRELRFDPADIDRWLDGRKETAKVS